MMFNKRLLCVSHSSKDFILINLFNPHDYPMYQILLFPPSDDLCIREL